jgi:phosphonate transport system substrate-binding protein
MPETRSQIRFASFLGDNAFDFYNQIVTYLGDALGIPARMVTDSSAGLHTLMGNGQIDAAFSCGLPYVWQASEPSPTVHLVAAPVLPGARYHDQPVYFADLVVRADSVYESLDDLRGSRFAYNETVSFSGYVLPLYHLVSLGMANRFFARVTATGSHAASMDWVEGGRADCAAIDSVVLEMEFARRPERARRLRVIESLGPAGMPPVVASARLPEPVRHQLGQALTHMHDSGPGRRILERGGVRRFAPVSDGHYDDIRHIVQALEQAGVSRLD